MKVVQLLMVKRSFCRARILGRKNRTIPLDIGVQERNIQIIIIVSHTCKRAYRLILFDRPNIREDFHFQESKVCFREVV